MALNLNLTYLNNYIKKNDLEAMSSEVKLAHSSLHNGTCAGSDFLGWMDLPVNYDREEFSRIKLAAAEIREKSDVLVVIGIGGSYLGARAVIEFIKGQQYNLTRGNRPEIYFAGNSISSDSLNELIEIIGDRDFSINIISKSGTTTEPAVAFRVLKSKLEEKYGDEAAKRIYATTDSAKGTLKEVSDKKGYQTFVVPNDVGGRFSVLTAVGLLPIAAAGIDIDALMSGAAKAMSDYSKEDLFDNDCYLYAAVRNLLYRNGKKIEMMISYEPAYTIMCEWFKQLFGESEGKDGKGIFPSSAIFSTDLHSMGQYIQQGERTMFETVVVFNKSKSEVLISEEEGDIDGLNFLSGHQLSFVNQKAFVATALAHTDGGVPNIVIELDKMDEEDLGRLIYFLEKACAMSGIILGVNPFDQPGVEMYKTNMFALLGKPGYEGERDELIKRLSE